MDEKVSRYPKVVIKDKFWYIADFTNPTRPKLLWRDFISRPIAKKALRILKKDYPDKFFQIIQGRDAKEHDIKVSRWWLNFRFEKYDYPPDRTRGQRRKTYRTIARRKLRKYSKAELKRKYPNLTKLL